MSAFSERLKCLRTTAGLSQRELAQKIDVSKSSINMYERGEREPGFETLESIADLFRVDINYLLGRNTFPIEHQSPQSNAIQDTGNLYVLSLKEHEIIEAYRNKPEMQPAVDRLLNVDDDTNSVKVYRAAKSEESHPDEIVPMSRERLQRLKDAPETDDTL